MMGSCRSTMAADVLSGLPLRAASAPAAPLHATPRRRMGPRHRAHPLAWLLVCALPTNAAAAAAAEASATAKDVSAAADGEAFRARAVASVNAASASLPQSPAALPETGAMAAARHLPSASCGGIAADARIGKEGAGLGGADAAVSGVSTMQLRAEYLESSLRDRLQAAGRERGGHKRLLRPVSFTLRESRGGRSLAVDSLPEVVAPLESPTPSLSSALSFLRSSLVGL